MDEVEDIIGVETMDYCNTCDKLMIDCDCAYINPKDDEETMGEASPHYQA